MNEIIKKFDTSREETYYELKLTNGDSYTFTTLEGIFAIMKLKGVDIIKYID